MTGTAVHSQWTQNMVHLIVGESFPADLLDRQTGQGGSKIGIGDDFAGFIDLFWLGRQQRLFQRSQILRRQSKCTERMLLIAGGMAHNIQHRNRLVISQLLRELLGKISSDILIQLHPARFY
ncbi:hypothetical protein D3C78_914150 [compost metagenome]